MGTAGDWTCLSHSTNSEHSCTGCWGIGTLRLADMTPDMQPPAALPPPTAPQFNPTQRTPQQQAPPQPAPSTATRDLSSSLPCCPRSHAGACVLTPQRTQKDTNRLSRADRPLCFSLTPAHTACAANVHQHQPLLHSCPPSAHTPPHTPPHVLHPCASLYNHTVI